MITGKDIIAAIQMESEDKAAAASCTPFLNEPMVPEKLDDGFRFRCPNPHCRHEGYILLITEESNTYKVYSDGGVKSLDVETTDSRYECCECHQLLDIEDLDLELQL